VGANSEHTSPRHSHRPTTVVAAFHTEAFGGTLVPLDTCVPGGALAGTFFNKAAPTIFGATNAFAGIAFRSLRGRPGACIILYLTHTSQSRLEARLIGYTSLLEDPVYLTPVWQPFNAHLVLPAGITANNIHRGNLHPRSEVVNHLIRVSGDRKLR
jgi:hypothetical protein